MNSVKRLSLPSKTDAYLYAQDVFFDHLNDVFFYVEDQDSEEFYFQVLTKLFPNMEFKNIFPLNGKNNVINTARETTKDNKRIYIVDKDFDDLLGLKIDLPNLFYLARYSIESYLIEEGSVIAFIISRNPKIHRAIVTSMFRFQETYLHMIKELSILLPFFLVVQSRETNRELSASLPVDRFLQDKQPYKLSKLKVASYKKK